MAASQKTQDHPEQDPNQDRNRNNSNETDSGTSRNSGAQENAGSQNESQPGIARVGNTGTDESGNDIDRGSNR